MQWLSRWVWIDPGKPFHVIFNNSIRICLFSFDFGKKPYFIHVHKKILWRKKHYWTFFPTCKVFDCSWGFLVDLCSKTKDTYKGFKRIFQKTYSLRIEQILSKFCQAWSSWAISWNFCLCLQALLSNLLEKVCIHLLLCATLNRYILHLSFLIGYHFWYSINFIQKSFCIEVLIISMRNFFRQIKTKKQKKC